MKDIEKKQEKTISIFEQLKHINEEGYEFWSARQLGKVLGYVEYRNFIPVIEKARIACANSGQLVANHFVDINEMIDIDSGAKRDNIKEKKEANITHFKVGKKVRQTIKELVGGTMPEDLPTVESIKKIEKKDKKKIK